MLKSFSGAKLVHVKDKSKFSFVFVEGCPIISIAFCLFHAPLSERYGVVKQSLESLTMLKNYGY